MWWRKIVSLRSEFRRKYRKRNIEWIGRGCCTRLKLSQTMDAVHNSRNKRKLVIRRRKCSYGQ